LAVSGGCLAVAWKQTQDTVTARFVVGWVRPGSRCCKARVVRIDRVDSGSEAAPPRFVMHATLEHTQPQSHLEDRFEFVQHGAAPRPPPHLVTHLTVPLRLPVVTDDMEGAWTVCEVGAGELCHEQSCPVAPVPVDDEAPQLSARVLEVELRKAGPGPTQTESGPVRLWWLSLAAEDVAEYTQPALDPERDLPDRGATAAAKAAAFGEAWSEAHRLFREKMALKRTAEAARANTDKDDAT
jgi:hypothetical protein